MTPSSDDAVDPRSGTPSVGWIGAGRMGAAIARAARQAGIE